MNPRFRVVAALVLGDTATEPPLSILAEAVRPAQDGGLAAMSDQLRNDPVNAETEGVARELCARLELDPNALVDGEPQGRGYVEVAANAIDRWRFLTR